ncbi:MAG: hypothetical protein ACI92S_001289 [Planctomycetaceae bacterium]|jgi:hypothetical protein
MKNGQGRAILSMSLTKRDPRQKTTHHSENVLLDEITTRFDMIAHQNSKSLIQCQMRPSRVSNFVSHRLMVYVSDLRLCVSHQTPHGNKLIHEVESLLLDELAARLGVIAHHDALAKSVTPFMSRGAKVYVSNGNLCVSHQHCPNQRRLMRSSTRFSMNSPQGSR